MHKKVSALHLGGIWDLPLCSLQLLGCPFSGFLAALSMLLTLAMRKEVSRQRMYSGTEAGHRVNRQGSWFLGIPLNR